MLSFAPVRETRAPGAFTPGMFASGRRFAVWAMSVALIGLLLWAVAIAAVVATFRVLAAPAPTSEKPR